MKARRFVVSRRLVASWRPVVLAVSALVLVSLLVLGLGGATPAPAAGTSFPDVPDTHPNAVAIADLAGRGIVNGLADGTFGPDSPVTRQQFAKMIVKTLGLAVTGTEVCPFTDVDPTPNAADPNYPARYVAVCAKQGISTGKTPTTFDPRASITRQQLITMVVRASGLPQPPAGYAPPFSAGQFTLTEHYTNACAAAYSGLLGDLGVDATYSFSAAATRGDCAQVLHNLLFKQAQGSAVDLIHFWWDFGPNWKSFQAENLTTVVGSGAGSPAGSAKIFGDFYYYLDTPAFPADYIFAAGENGDLLVFSSTSGTNWSVQHVPAPGGTRISAMLGGRAFDEVTSVTINGNVKTLHVFATDSDDNLVHFWLTQGGTWQAENVSAKVGQKMHLMGWACTWEDYSVVQVVGTSAGGDLVHFWLKDGGTWKSEDVSQLTGRTIKGEASFNWDANGGLGTAVVAAGPNDELLIFHHKSLGQWTVEDVTAATATGGKPGVTLGGWLSWWSWDAIWWDASQFHYPVAVLDPSGHFWLLERAGAGSWTAKDVSADIGQTFRMETGGDSILVFDNPPSIPDGEAHFAGVNQDDDLIHFWRDTAGKWHSENMSAKSGQKIRYPVNQYLREGTGPGGQSGWCDYVCAVAPNGDLVFIWDNAQLRDWAVFSATTVTGFKVRASELPWLSGHDNLVLARAE